MSCRSAHAETGGPSAGGTALPTLPGRSPELAGCEFPLHPSDETTDFKKQISLKVSSPRISVELFHGHLCVPPAPRRSPGALSCRACLLNWAVES